MEHPELVGAAQALDRGDYGRVLALLKPLAERHPVSTACGASLRLMMVTALMGQGQNELAAECCRELRRCADATVRNQARDLLQVLQAPALTRPREWSLNLPDLAQGAPLEAMRGGRSRSRKPPAPPPPPVGETRSPLGFAAACLLLICLLLVVAGLSGCMEVRSELRFQGPGRLQLSHHLRSDSGALTPWQLNLASALAAQGFRSELTQGEQVLSTDVLPAQQLLEALDRSLRRAGELSGHDLPPIAMDWQEQNWGIGVVQRLSLELDLRNLADLKGVDLTLVLEPLQVRSIQTALPQAVRPQGKGLIWPLKPGESNRLQLQCWRWNPLGLGSVAVGLVLLLSLVLQRLRQKLGFGYPELPA